MEHNRAPRNKPKLFGQLEKNQKLINGQRTWIEIFPKQKYIKPNSTWIDYSTSLIIKKMQMKSQWDITSPLSEWLLLKRQWIASAGEDMEKRETCALFVGMWFGTVTMENIVLLKFKNRIIQQSRISASEYFSE